MVHIHIGRMIFVDPSMTYMYKMRNIDIGYKFFVDPSMTYTFNVQDGSYRYSTKDSSRSNYDILVQCTR